MKRINITPDQMCSLVKIIEMLSEAFPENSIYISIDAPDEGMVCTRTITWANSIE